MIEAQRLFPAAAAGDGARRLPWRLIAGLGLGLLLGGCGSFETRDGGPDHHPDLTAIPDAVPRIEPYSRYGNPAAYEVAGRTYYVRRDIRDFHQRGQASWYGTKFHGRRTSSGEPYDMYAMSAAHKTLPIPSYVEIINRDNGRKAVVRINDRGPFVEGRIIDLSYAAARKLGVYDTGTAPVEIRLIDPRAKPPAAPPPATTSAADSRASTADARIYLQVGAFSERDNAEQMLSHLLSLTDEQVLINPGVNGATSIYRVRIGPLDSEQQARHLAAQLTPHGIDTAHLIRE